MDAARRQRITDSFNALAPQAEALADLFYEKMFTDHPEVRSMFPDDMNTQKMHLLTSLGLIVKNIDNFASLEGPLMKMGARHIDYGTRPEHYPVVAGALLGAMAELAGPIWTTQLEEDWTAAINTVAGVMIKGAESRGQLRTAA